MEPRSSRRLLAAVGRGGVRSRAVVRSLGPGRALARLGLADDPMVWTGRYGWGGVRRRPRLMCSRRRPGLVDRSARRPRSRWRMRRRRGASRARPAASRASTRRSRSSSICSRPAPRRGCRRVARACGGRGSALRGPLADELRRDARRRATSGAGGATSSRASPNGSICRTCAERWPSLTRTETLGTSLADATPSSPPTSGAPAGPRSRSGREPRR